jgi:histidine triad (HIT) family protein
MLSEEESEKIKEKIISHIEENFPEEQKSNAINQIKSMNNEQLENFLEKNNLIKTDSEGSSRNIEMGNQECVFCAIASDKIKSVRIGENEKAIAVLEINPISQGHFIVIPKKHTDKAPKEALELAKEISKKIQKKFSPKSMEISKSKLFGHEVINILPVYSDETFDSKRKSATIEELESIKEELEKKSQKISKPKTEKIKEFLWLPKRIP